jgi:hypothetical protein
MSAGELLPSFDGKYLKDLLWHPPEEVQTELPTRGGNPQVHTFGRPKWRLTVAYDGLPDGPAREMSAFLARRKQAAVSFTATRLSRRTPRNAPSLTNAGLTLGGVDLEAGTVQVNGVGGLIIFPGDMVSYRTLANGYWVGLATATANPSAGNIVIPVYPPPKTPHEDTPAVRLVDVLGEFKLAGRSRNTEPYDGRESVSFEAVQVIR